MDREESQPRGMVIGFHGNVQKSVNVILHNSTSRFASLEYPFTNVDTFLLLKENNKKNAQNLASIMKLCIKEATTKLLSKIYAYFT